MIIDKVENLKNYAQVNPLFPKVVEFIQQHDLNELEPGKYEIEGKDLFVNIQMAKGKTPAEAVIETHNRMIDIQIPLSDAETFGYTQRDQLPDAEYNAEKDITKIPDLAAVAWERQERIEGNTQISNDLQTDVKDGLAAFWVVFPHLPRLALCDVAVADAGQVHGLELGIAELELLQQLLHFFLHVLELLDSGFVHVE